MFKSTTQVETNKASRYLKALCNHFDRKVTAAYTDNHGTVQFGFAYCEMDATANTLIISIQSEDTDGFARAKHVIDDHLVRFANDDSIVIEWVDQS